jgi:hypothetical protein
VMVHPERFLKHKQSRMWSTIRRPRHIPGHPGSIRNSDFNSLGYNFDLVHKRFSDLSGPINRAR